MPTTNLYFSNYSFTGEQRLIEDLIIEAIKIYGVECYYLPRTLVNDDDVWGEDASSKFEVAYPLEMYIKNVEGFEGEGDFLSKFGLEIRDSVTLTISQRRFGEELHPDDTTSEAGRPVEGDLIWFPLNGKIFEVKHVEHEAIFYQLGSLQTYDLRCELFEYSSEIIDTGVGVIDDIGAKYSIDELIQQILFETYTDTAFANVNINNGTVLSVDIIHPGENFTNAPIVTFESPEGEPVRATGEAILDNGRIIGATIINGGGYYSNAPNVTFARPFANGESAIAVAGLTQGTVSDINVLSGGFFYLNPPTVNISEPNGIFMMGGRISNTESIMGDYSLYYESAQRFNRIRGLENYANSTFDFFIKPVSNNSSGVIFSTVNHSISVNNGILEVDSVASNGQAITTDAWTYVMLQANTSTIHLRQDEILVAQTETSSSFANGFIRIGEPNGNSFVGFYDALRYRDSFVDDVRVPITNTRAATGTVSVTDGKVSGITVSDGGGYYTEVPTVTVDPPTGYSRTANVAVSVNNHSIVAPVINDGGFYYTTPPQITISPPENLTYDQEHVFYGNSALYLTSGKSIVMSDLPSQEYGTVSLLIKSELEDLSIAEGALPSNTDFIVSAEYSPPTYYFNVDSVDDLELPENPTITLYRGLTYTFDTSNPEEGYETTPLWIKDSLVEGNNISTYDNGVTNNGVANGVIRFVVPNDAPDTLYYVNGEYFEMNGELNIQDIPVSQFCNDVIAFTDDWNIKINQEAGQYVYEFNYGNNKLTNPSWSAYSDFDIYRNYTSIEVQVYEDDEETKSLAVRMNGVGNTVVLTSSFNVSNGSLTLGAPTSNNYYDGVTVSDYSNTSPQIIYTGFAIPQIGTYSLWGANVTYSQDFSNSISATAVSSVSNGTVTSITITNNGFGYIEVPTITVANVSINTYSTATATATISDGTVSNFTVTNSGVGYASVPNITVSNAVFNEFTSGTSYANSIYVNSFEYITAQANSVINSNGAVIAINVIEAGFGYQSPPIVTVEVPNTDLYITATGTTEISNGVVTAVNITNGGFGYTQSNGYMVINPPIYNTAEGFAVLNANGEVSSITITDSGQGYTSVPNVFITGDPIEGSLQTEEGQFFLHEESNTTNLSTDNDYAQNDKFQEIIDAPVTTEPNDDTTFIDFSERNPFSEGGEW